MINHIKLFAVVALTTSVCFAVNAQNKKYEDLGILTQMMKPEQQRIMKGLDLAETLTFNGGKPHPLGDLISADQCKNINQRVSQNYKLHSYEEAVPAKSGNVQFAGYVDQQGVKICPTTGIHNDEYISTKDTKLNLFRGQIKNAFGVSATMVLTVNTVSWSNGGVTTSEQYLLNEKYQVIEYLELRGDRAGLFWFDISALTPEGHVAGKAKKIYSNKNDSSPYIWKGASSFVLGDGKGSAVRAHQNDGKGVAGKEEMITVAYQGASTKFEVSPFTDTSALYDNGPSDSSRRLKSVLYVDIYTKAGKSCAHGYIGYDPSGNSIRDFGDIECSKKQDMQTTIR